MASELLAKADAGSETETFARQHVSPSAGFTALLIALLLALVHGDAQGASTSFERFFGSYKGVSTSIPKGETAKREISVTIGPNKDGFKVDWETVMRKANGDVRRRRWSVDFRPTRRKNIYASAMRKNLFGHAVPNNPLKGDPLVWATVAGDSFIVYAARVMDSGTQDLEIYKRTLTSQGIHSEFHRFHDAQEIRRITSDLARVGGAKRRVEKEEPSPFEPES